MNNSFSRLNHSFGLLDNFSKLSTIIIFCIIVLSNTLYAKNPCEVTVNSEIKIKNAETIKVFIRTADSVTRTLLVSKKLHNQKISRIYNITILTASNTKIKFKFLKKGILSIELPNIAKELQNSQYAPQIIGAMILKYSAQKITNENISKLPPWLIYSILGKVKNRLDKSSIPGIFFVPAVHAFVSSGEDEGLLKIVESKTYPTSGPSHQLFLELSQVLLKSIRKLPKWREGLHDLVDLSINANYAPAYFEQIFRKKVNTYIANTTVLKTTHQKDENDNALEKWFYNNAVQLSVNVFNPANAAFSEKLFRKIEIVKYPATFEDSEGNLIEEERYCKISDLPDKQAEILNFDSVVKGKEYEFAILGYSVPYNFQPSIFKIKKALINLRINTKSDIFKTEYEKEKNIFFNKISKQYELEAYLKKSERKYVPEIWQYRYELQQIKIYKTKIRKRWKALTKYLNLWESKLKNTTE